MVFDKTRVYSLWSDSLEGTYGIFADDLGQLESFVLGHPPAENVGRVLSSDDAYLRFKRASTNVSYKYYYLFEFSPYWDKYLNGEAVYVKHGQDMKRIPDDIELTNQLYWSDNLEYSLEGSLSSSPLADLLKGHRLLTVALPEDHQFDPQRVRAFPSDNDDSAMFCHYCFADTVADLSRMVSSGLVTLYGDVEYDEEFVDVQPWMTRQGSWLQRFMFAYDLHGLVLGVQESPVVKLEDVRCCEPASNIFYGSSCGVPPGILATSLKDLHQQVKGFVPVKAFQAVTYTPGDPMPYKSVVTTSYASDKIYSASVLYPALSFRRDCTLYVEV